MHVCGTIHSQLFHLYDLNTGALTCATSDPEETCKVKPQLDPARHMVSDVRYVFVCVYVYVLYVIFIYLPAVCDS